MSDQWEGGKLTSYLSRSSMAATAEKREECVGVSKAAAPLMSRARPLVAFCADSCSGLKVHACSDTTDAALLHIMAWLRMHCTLLRLHQAEAVGYLRML